jgi:hypothetical protein
MSMAANAASEGGKFSEGPIFQDPVHYYLILVSCCSLRRTGTEMPESRAGP